MLAGVNRALESGGELPEGVWTEWLWESQVSLGSRGQVGVV